MNFILWNPSPNEYKLIPPSPFDSGPSWYLLVQYHGFGYDNVRYDYKVMNYALHAALFAPTQLNGH
jgi:hypothetical protein